MSEDLGSLQERLRRGIKNEVRDVILLHKVLNKYLILVQKKMQLNEKTQSEQQELKKATNSQGGLS